MRKITLLVFFSITLFSAKAINIDLLLKNATRTLNSNPDSSFIYSEMVIKNAKNNSDEMAKALKNKGQIYYYKGNYPKALDYYQQAQKIAEKEKYNSTLLSLYNLFGTFYKKQNNLKASLEQFTAGYKLAEKTNDTASMAALLGDIGLIHQLNNEIIDAIDCFSRSLKLYQKMGSKLGESYCLNYLAEVYASEKKYTQAIAFLERGLKLRIEEADSNAIAVNYANLGEVYIQMNNSKKALFYFEKCKNISEKINYADLLKHCYKMMSNIYYGNKNFEYAYLYHTYYSNLKDSIYNEQNARLVSEMEAKYQNEKKQLLIDNLNKENEINEVKLEQQTSKTKNLYILSSLLLIIALGILVGYKNKQKANKLISEQKLEVEKQKSKVEAKQKEILDSIQYAKRIQQSLLPTEKYIEKNINRTKK
jgi:tetratricopeptide (TPR) repeat protein